MSSMANVLSTEKRVSIISALVEGVSVRATARMVGVSKDTVMKLGVEMGEACARYQDEALRELTCRRLQVDEVWSFVYAKAKNVPQDRLGEFVVGDVWTFTAIDAETKLIPSFLIGSRGAGRAPALLPDPALPPGQPGPADHGRAQDVPLGRGRSLPGLRGLRAAGEDLRRRQRGREALQPGRLHRVRADGGYGPARPQARLHVLRGAQQPDGPHERSSLHPADQRLLQEAPQPRGGGRPVHGPLQLLPHPPDP